VFAILNSWQKGDVFKVLFRVNAHNRLEVCFMPICKCSFNFP